MSAAIVTIAAGVVLAGTATGFAAERLKPDEIKATFFTGQPFTASSPGSTKYTMVFAADGTATRTPVGKSGAKGEGRAFGNADDVMLALEAGELETLSPIRLRYTGDLQDLTASRDDQDVRIGGQGQHR